MNRESPSLWPQFGTGGETSKVYPKSDDHFDSGMVVGRLALLGLPLVLV